jgi:hypothetical protein
MKPTKNVPLIIGISLPVVFIIIISVIIFLPSLFIKPKYNFLYSNSDSYYTYDFNRYSSTFEVLNGRLSISQLSTTTGITYKTGTPPLFVYDVKTNTSHQVDFNEVQKYVIDPGPSSPDGYIVKYEYGNNGIFELFGSGGNQSGYVLSKGNTSKKLNGLISGSYYYSYNNLKFIGWIK